MAKKKKKTKTDSSRDKINEDLDNIRQNGSSSEFDTWFTRPFITCYIIIPDLPPDEDESDDSDEE